MNPSLPKKAEGLASELSSTIGSPRRDVSPNSLQNPAIQQSIDFDKIKNKLEIFKKSVLKKYKFTISLSLLPAQASFLFEEHNNRQIS